MKLLIYSDQQPPIVPLDNNSIEVVHKDDINIDDIPNYLYDEIECYNYLEYTEDDGLDKLIAKMSSKATLRLKGVDIFQASKSFTSGNISTSQMSEAIAKGRRRCFSVHELAESISSKNLNVVFAGI
jgi:hypothetical protein